MSKVILLEELKAFSEAVTKDLRLPVAQQKGDPGPPPPKAPQVFRPRLPDSRAAAKKAPYILHQILTGKDIQPPGKRVDSTAVVRTVFCVYHPDEQEGGLALLNLMEQLRLSLLERPILDEQFRLDLEAGLEELVYPEDVAPYYAGEMITVWHLPPVARLDTARIIHGLPLWDPMAKQTEKTVIQKGSDQNGKEK